LAPTPELCPAGSGCRNLALPGVYEQALTPFPVLILISFLQNLTHATRFQKQRHPQRFASPRHVHKLRLGRSQEEMFDHFLVRIRGSELRIGIRHGTASWFDSPGAISQNEQNLKFSACICWGKRLESRLQGKN
jgi:hypothetical protein